ncbi:unnamed protein product [Cladocopium goreaui]|uniref:Uncharacterized protein n=1 Tax=Cladocopium goreaui TaxID=2562237 RepID=A0A9P1DD44_9DINO|nr:unnamed protein product [Cladocopium goreaui]
MQQHYATDYSEGIDFVRDRLADSLQLLGPEEILGPTFTHRAFVHKDLQCAQCTQKRLKF